MVVVLSLAVRRRVRDPAADGHASAGVHQGPLVIDREETLVGKPERSSAAASSCAPRASTIRNVTVVGGENGIDVEDAQQRDARRRARDRVADGRHPRPLLAVMIEHCTVTVAGEPCAQGIDISYSVGQGMSMV